MAASRTASRRTWATITTECWTDNYDTEMMVAKIMVVLIALVLVECHVAQKIKNW
jgi:hypothetical protein